MTKRIPRPEHPEPMMVRYAWLNLNGEWAFEFDPGNSGTERSLVEKKILPADYGAFLSGE